MASYPHRLRAATARSGETFFSLIILAVATSISLLQFSPRGQRRRNDQCLDHRFQCIQILLHYRTCVVKFNVPDSFAPAFFPWSMNLTAASATKGEYSHDAIKIADGQNYALHVCSPGTFVE